MALLLKIVPNKFENQSRDKRELSVVQELGHNIIVVAKGEKNEAIVIDGYNVHCRTTRPLGGYKKLISLNRIVSLFAWARYARKIKPDCISGHDLTGLFIAWLSTLFIARKKRPFLVYDAHEFEIGRNSDGKRNRLDQFCVKVMEKFLIDKCVFSIMVNDSIADEVQKIHKLKEKPIVVRNIPNRWNIDKDVCKRKRAEIYNTMGIDKDSFIVMYHGGIARNRGLENIIKAIALAGKAHLIILGYGENEYIEQLKFLIKEMRLESRVHFMEAVPIDVLWKYVGAADVGVTLTPNTCVNHYFMLPNKLFENIQAETPVIGSNFPEIKRIVEGYDIGLCCDPHNFRDIAATIEKIRDDKDLHNKFKENISIAKEELCWEDEKRILEKAYKKVLG